MGEKIRDLHPITIGKSSFMIELNEGYTASQGRLIHIQNKKFRYLLTEDDFYRMSTMVLRAWSEFEYIKNQKIEQKSENDFVTREDVSNVTYDKLKSIAQWFQSNDIEYRVLDVQNKIITIIVHENSLPRFKKSIKKAGWDVLSHPYGQDYGYRFIYQMTPFLMYKYEGLFVEVYCQLPCASLTPKMWIPLDRKIQTNLWNTPEMFDNVKMCNIQCQYMYHLCWAVFLNKGFSPYSRLYLNKHKSILSSDTMKEFIPLVFFNYTDSLIKHIESDEYDSIISDYYSFINY